MEEKLMALLAELISDQKGVQVCLTKSETQSHGYLYQQDSQE